MLHAFLPDFLILLHLAEQVADITNEAFTLGKVAKGGHLAAMRALGAVVLDPGAQAFLAGHLAAGRAHFGLLQRLETDVAVQEGKLGTCVHALCCGIVNIIIGLSIMCLNLAVITCSHLSTLANPRATFVNPLQANGTASVEMGRPGGMDSGKGIPLGRLYEGE